MREGGRKGRRMLMIYTINIYQTQEFAATGKVVAFVSQTSGGGGGGGTELGVIGWVIIALLVNKCLPTCVLSCSTI